MTASTDTVRGSDFAALCREIRESQLLERRRGTYAVRVGLTIGALVATWLVFAAVGDSWWQLAIALLMGFVSTQVSFLGHDSSHQQVARSKRTNIALSLVVGDLLAGFSYGWWVDKHNRHHAHPNHEGHDPDIGEGVLAFTTEQAASRTGAVARWVTRNQALLFFPLLTLEGMNLHAQSILWLAKGEIRRYRKIEAALLTAHVVGYVALVFAVLPLGKGLAFIAIHQAVWGVYMGCSFAPNHKGMPTIPEDEQMDFLRRQVVTTRNVRGGWFTDFLLGGLNYQVEHHLFPNMPRTNLHKAQPIVRGYCDRMGLSYTETSLLGSYAAALRHLHALGEPLRAERRALRTR